MNRCALFGNDVRRAARQALLIILAGLMPISGVGAAQRLQAASRHPDATRPVTMKAPRGALNPSVTQASIRETICVRGWTRTVRPPLAYTNEIKRRLLREHGIAASEIHAYELDHLIPLSLGGSPTAMENLWLQPWNGPWGAQTKDRLEARLNFLVCTDRLPLAQAQEAIRTDWIAAYRRFFPHTRRILP